MRYYFICLFSLLTFFTFHQSQAQETPADSAKALYFDGFIDIFYAYDFNRPADHVRQPFLYNHNRHNEFNLNLGLVRANYQKDGIRAKLGLQTGTYAQDNYSAEEELLKNVFEAHVGVVLDNAEKLWLDAGIFPSHLGFESAISTNNPTLTRSLVAENSPYFLSGAKLTYDPSNKLTLLAVACNGWQRIARVAGNQTIALGTQVNYRPSANLTLNWSTFVGNDFRQTAKRTRFFNNLYAIVKASEKVNIILGADYGIQEKAPSLTEEESDSWYGLTAIARFQLSEKAYLAARGEYYSDEDGVIVNYGARSPFKTLGFSLNFDYLVRENVMARIEARQFLAKDHIFMRFGAISNEDFFITASLAIKFR